MNESIMQIISVNNLITKFLNSDISVGEENLKELLNRAIKIKEEANLTDYALSTEYDSLVENIRKLKEKLGIPEEKPKKLTPYGDRELERGQALVEAMSTPFDEYKQRLKAAREERYTAMIAEQATLADGQLSRR